MDDIFSIIIIIIIISNYKTMNISLVLDDLTFHIISIHPLLTMNILFVYSFVCLHTCLQQLAQTVLTFRITQTVKKHLFLFPVPYLLMSGNYIRNIFW